MNLTSLLKADRINLDLKARKKDDVLKELVGMIKSGDEADQIYQRLVEREDLGSTGIGKGIAIPHSRSLLVSKLELAIGRSAKGVSFDTIDKKPAFLFFLIIAPPQDPGNQYLVALGRVALVSQNLAKNKLYMEPKTPAEMIQLIRDAEEKIR
jgi:mannitol/fructose-specific phosphotransferase system IIA component (Ntr-type)